MEELIENSSQEELITHFPATAVRLGERDDGLPMASSSGDGSSAAHVASYATAKRQREGAGADASA